MRPFLSLFRRYAPWFALLLGVLFGVGLLTYLAGWLGSERDLAPIQRPAAPLTVVPPLPGTPIVRYSRVDPAIVEALDRGPAVYAPIPLDILGADVQPVGAYLPRTGNMLFEIIAPTALPTPLPYATSPPLPLPYVPQQILPTVSIFDESGQPRTLPYTGGVCAPSGLPVDGVLTQRFHAYHSGIDLGIPLGTPVLATHSGTVVYADWSDVGYGYLVIIQNDAFITYYAHNTSFNVNVNQLVGRGSIIAWSGSTGNSTGPHVHYETRINDVPVDPLTFEDRGYISC